MAEFLLFLVLGETAVSIAANRRKKLDLATQVRGIRTLTIALLIFWATFSDGTAVRLVGLVAAGVTVIAGVVQLTVVTRARRLDSV